MQGGGAEDGEGCLQLDGVRSPGIEQEPAQGVDSGGGEVAEFEGELSGSIRAKLVECLREGGTGAAPVMDGRAVDACLGSGSGNVHALSEQIEDRLLTDGEWKGRMIRSGGNRRCVQDFYSFETRGWCRHIRNLRHRG